MRLTHKPHAPADVEVVISVPRTSTMKKQLLLFLCYVPMHGAMCPMHAVCGNLSI